MVVLARVRGGGSWFMVSWGPLAVFAFCWCWCWTHRWVFCPLILDLNPIGCFGCDWCSPLQSDTKGSSMTPRACLPNICFRFFVFFCGKPYMTLTLRILEDQKVGQLRGGLQMSAQGLWWAFVHPVGGGGGWWVHFEWVFSCHALPYKKNLLSSQWISCSPLWFFL